MFKTVAIAMLLAGIFSTAVAQKSTRVSGTVIEAASGEPLAGVNIVVKGKVVGTVTDNEGQFELTIADTPPLTLTFSFIGFRTEELQVTEPSMQDLHIAMEEQSLLGMEIVISASRVEENILKSPVSIEKMGFLAVQNVATDDYYKAIANLKGVDIATSSINFQVLNTRGFAATGNSRFVQLIDGMDTQAPALNFPIGNLNGPSELDVESIELIPGASSALYGPNAFNGILLINSKSPFDFQGTSAMVKLGANHIGSEADQDAAPLYTASVRYAKAFKNKFAFKANLTYMRAEDWHGTSTFDRNAALTPEGYSFNPGSDKLHFMGDEASTNIGFLGFAAQTAFAVEGTANDNPAFVGLRALFRGTNSQAFSGGQSARNYLTDVPSQTVSRTPYKEANLINYNAENLKINSGLYYRLSDKHELSYLLNYGYGTSIYTGAQRYSLSDFSITQHRLQLRSDKYFIRSYATIEDSGNSYITEFLGNLVNTRYSPNPTWFATYTANYLSYLGGTNLQGGTTGAGLNPGEINDLPMDERIAIEQNAHNYARSRADFARIPADSENFETIKNEELNRGTIPTGPKFADNTRLYHAEGQYDFKNEIKFLGLQAGASYRIYDLRSNGTIFPDEDGGIQINEYGAYFQASKNLANDNLKLTTSLRYDKNENFTGQFSPRFSTVWTIAEDHNIRGSIQTGFRNPTTQGQYIDLNIISARLLGGLPAITDRYNLTTNSFTGSSVNNYADAVFSQGSSQAAIFSNRDKLEPFTEKDLQRVKPERIRSFEIGYKSLIQNQLFIDAAYYYNVYNDFITQIRVRTANGNPFANDLSEAYSASASLLSGNANNTFQFYTNVADEVSSQGAVLGIGYNLPRDFTLEGNYSWNRLNQKLDNFITAYNTPENKINLSIENRKLTDKMGFRLTWRWQEAFIWESTFAIGEVPAYHTLDAQVSYKLRQLRSNVKIGGSNILNKYYIQSLGGPSIGAIYYISLTFDELIK